MKEVIRWGRYGALAWAIAIVGAIVTAAHSAEPKAPKNSHILTVDDQTLSAPITGLRNGELQLGSESPSEVPLADVARIDNEVKPALSAVWMGTASKVAAPASPDKSKKSFRIHLVIQGLPVSDSISQLNIQCGSERWELHAAPASTSSGGASRNAQPASGLMVAGRVRGSDTVDLAFDGSKADYSNQSLSIALKFEKGGTQTVKIKAPPPAKPNAKAGEAKVATENTDAPLRAILFLDGGDRLSGEVLGLSKESLRLRTRWQNELELPLVRLRGIQFLGPELEESRELFERQLAASGNQDTVIARNKDQST